ncbi:MAG: PhoU domain-containing protein [Candidatus Bathyarchaeia archaeon]
MSGKEEIRRIQVTGRSSFIVSIPKSWAKEMTLRPGDPMTFTKQDDGSLLLLPRSSQRAEKLEEARIYIGDSDNLNSITRLIISLYLVGYRVITMTAKEARIPSRQREMLRELTKRKLIGAEIVEESSREMTLQVLLSYPELTVEHAIRRMSRMALSMHKDAVAAFEDLDQDLCKHIVATDDEVDRFALYVIRLLKSTVQNHRLIKEIGLYGPRDCLGYRLIASSIEGAADHAADMAQNVLALKEKPHPQIVKRVNDMSGATCTVFDDAIRALFKRSYDIAEEAVERARSAETMEGKIVELLSSIPMRRDSATCIRLILESIRRTAEYASDIGEVVLNLTAIDRLKRAP